VRSQSFFSGQIGLLRDFGSEIITIGVSLAVSIIPEGLVTVVTLTMALGMQRMAARNAIVRQVRPLLSPSDLI